MKQLICDRCGKVIDTRKENYTVDSFDGETCFDLRGECSDGLENIREKYRDLRIKEERAYIKAFKQEGDNERT